MATLYKRRARAPLADAEPLSLGWGASISGGQRFSLMTGEYTLALTPRDMARLVRFVAEQAPEEMAAALAADPHPDAGHPSDREADQLRRFKSAAATMLGTTLESA